jgi:hypothetical protein
MNRVVCALLLWCALSRTGNAQVFVGDSLRVRNGHETTWRYGRLVHQDASTFTLQQGSDTLRVAIGDLRRVDRWKRNSPSWILAIASVGMLAAELGYNAQTPRNQRSSSEYWTYGVVGALGGAAMGLIAFTAWPGQWKIVFDR